MVLGHIVEINEYNATDRNGGDKMIKASHSTTQPKVGRRILSRFTNKR